MGRNNRNLRTFDVSLQQTLDLLPALTAGKTSRTESASAEPMSIYAQPRRHTFLIGETFMRADDIEAGCGSCFKFHIAQSCKKKVV